MSALFNVKIESVCGATVKAPFQVCHPDQWDVPANANIALQTVVEVFWNMKMGFELGANDDQPIGREQASVLVRTHPRRAQLEHWLELAHGKRVIITAEEYNRIKIYGSENEKLAGYGFRDGVYHKQYHSEYARFMVEAEREIVEVHLEDEVGNPKKQDNDPDPKATLVFTIKDAAHLFHMVEGFHFGSAMYDFCVCCARM